MIERVTGRGAVAASVYPGSRSKLHSSAIGCACGLLLLTTGPAFSQAFPAKPIRLVIPFAVGGSSDANARIIMPALTERWKQQIVLDPRPGAGTVIGTDLVAKSAPDGHTLLLTSNLFTNAPITYAKLPYDPHTDRGRLLRDGHHGGGGRRIGVGIDQGEARHDGKSGRVGDGAWRAERSNGLARVIMQERN
jgi:hypothetical protein